MDRQIIFNKIRDSRFITVRRGGTLLDADHHLIAVWAADCAQLPDEIRELVLADQRLRNERCWSLFGC